MNLDELKEMCEKATPVPWKYSVNNNGSESEIYPTGFRYHINAGWLCDDPECNCMETTNRVDNDGKFIALARTAVPVLIRVIESVAEYIVEGREHEIKCMPDFMAKSFLINSWLTQAEREIKEGK